MWFRLKKSLRRAIKRSVRPHTLFPTLAVVVSFGLWAVTLHMLSSEREDAEKALRQSSQLLAETYEARIIRALREIDQHLKTVKYAYEKEGDTRVLTELKQRQLLPPHLLFNVAIMDANGGTITSTEGDAVAPGDALPAWRSNNDEINVALFSKDRVLVQFSQSIKTDNPTEQRRVVIEFSPDYFVSSYQTSQLGERGMLSALSLYRGIGAWRSGNHIQTGGLEVYSSMAKQLAPGESKTFLKTSPIDGEERFMTIRRLSSFPVAIIAGLSRAEQLKVADRHAEIYIIRTAVANVFFLAIMGLLWRMSAKLAASRQQARETRRAYEQELTRMAFYDGLTGLPNRSLFSSLLKNAIHQARRANEKVAVLFLDIDHFKQINDTLGHAAGDKLLQEFAERLKCHVRESDIVARISGDEFVAILPNVKRGEDAVIVGNKLIAAVDRPFEAIGKTFSVTVSVGISLFPNDGTDEDTLLRHADEAMYVAKAQGKNRVGLYSKNAICASTS